jgi:membrane associated rhomboid family serine protease
MIHPSFNPMIGPSPYVLINMGARYVPCMRKYDIPNTNLTLASPTVGMQCPNTTTGEVPATGFCTLADLCGFGLSLTPSSDGTQPQPNQWFRFITPMFMHGGIIHIGFNLLLQLTLGRDIEKQIGTLRFLLVYLSSGIFGFVFGGNFAPNGISSTGCSGALFGLLAINLLDLLYTWKTRPSPGKDLAFILLDVGIAFVLGLLPTLDNFSHIGGFLMGLVLGICILHSPNSLRERIGLDEPPYSSVPGAHGNKDDETGTQAFIRRPVGFFKGRKPLWWAWWLVRAGALVGVLVAFIVLLRNFYVFRSNCSWCKYLSCLVSPKRVARSGTRADYLLLAHQELVRRRKSAVYPKQSAPNHRICLRPARRMSIGSATGQHGISDTLPACRFSCAIFA